MQHELISNREFARRVRVNEANIRQHIAAGNFSSNSFDEDAKGKKKLIWKIAKKEWDSFCGGSKKEIGSGMDNEAIDKDLPDIADSRRMTEYYKAQTAKIEFQKERGELVLRSEVDAELFELGSNVRKALLGVPDVCVDDVMAAATRHEAHAAIYSAIEKALFSLTGDKLDNEVITAVED